MKDFILKFLVCSGVFFTLIYVVDLFIETGLRKTSYREISKWDEVITGGIDAEILIVGSSRALVHFDPRVIEKKFGLSCYNLGLDGSRYESQKKVLELYLTHNDRPKILYWVLDLTSFQVLEGVYRYEQFIPYISEPAVKEIFTLNKDMDLGYMNIPLMRYSSNQSLKYRGLFPPGPMNWPTPELINGYREQDRIWDGKFDEFRAINKEGKETKYDSFLYQDFKKLSKELQSEGIEIRWVVAPYYTPALDLITNSSEIFKTYSDGSKELRIDFQNFSSPHFSSDKQYFYNGSHLNKKGVEQFMSVFDISQCR